MTLNLDFDIEKIVNNETEKERILELGPIKLFSNLLSFLIERHYSEGLSGNTQKVVYRIFNKLESTDILLEAGEQDFLKDLFIKFDIPIPLSILKVFMFYKTKIEKLED